MEVLSLESVRVMVKGSYVTKDHMKYFCSAWKYYVFVIIDIYVVHP